MSRGYCGIVQQLIHMNGHAFAVTLLNGHALAVLYAFFINSMVKALLHDTRLTLGEKRRWVSLKASA